MANISIDVRGENCPVPLIETRKAVRKANTGDIIEITGTHPASKKEIPMAVRNLGLELLEIIDKDDYWIIKIKR